VLRQVAGFLKANWPVRLVRVDGHTDDAGDRERNVDLSERRARQVVAFLVGEGVAPARLDAKGFGPKVPVAPNRTEAGRAQNRRVEFTVLRTVGTEAGQ
jgi:outer membrane protein OmpA-like peptidoglycan-associated protein